jgi:hypothetical protein
MDNNPMHAQENKTCVVMDSPQPENRKDRSCIPGLTSSYGTFIEHYAHIAMPLKGGWLLANTTR